MIKCDAAKKKCDAACTKHVSQSLVQRKHSMNVDGNGGGGGGGDDDNDIMSTEAFRKSFWGILSSVTLNLTFFKSILPFDLKQCRPP